jgi:hypothetical protein
MAGRKSTKSDWAKDRAKDGGVIKPMPESKPKEPVDQMSRVKARLGDESRRKPKAEPKPKKPAEAKAPKQKERPPGLEEMEAGATLATPGRPVKFKPEWVSVARKMTELGAIEAEIADAFEVDLRTITRWKHEYPEFLEALKVGKEVADDRVEQSLYRLATGYTFDAEEIKMSFGVPLRVQVRKHLPPDSASVAMWLKNRMPDRWRDTKHIKHDVEDGGPLDRFMSEVQGRTIRPREEAAEEPSAEGPRR